MTTGMPELGSKISLISKADIRYEGRLFTVDPQECTIALASVRSFGTEERETQYPVPAQNQVYDYILFRGSDIKDIRVVNNVPHHPQPLNDPAIMQLSVPPSLGGQQFQSHPVLGNIGPHQFGSAGGGAAAGGGGGAYGGMSAIGGLTNNLPAPGGMVGAPPGGGMQGIIGVGGAHKSELLIGPPPPADQPSPLLATNADSVVNRHELHDLIGGGAGGSRCTTPANSLGSRKSPTNDQGVQAGGSKRHDDKRIVRPIQPPGGRGDYHRNQNQHHQRRSSNSRERRDSRGDGQHKNQNRQPMNRHQGGYHQGGGGGYQQQNNRGGNGGGGWINRGPMRQRGRPRGGPGFKPNNQNQASGGGNKKNTLKFENDFDFEQANTEFEELRSQLNKVKIEDGGSASVGSAAADKSATGVKTGEVNGDVDSKKDDSGNETGAGETEQEEEHEVYYDKSKSFFDKISCEAVERAKGKSQRTDWRTERKLNSETFGVAATRRGNYRGGRGGYRGMGGGYRGNYRGNNNYNRPNQQRHYNNQHQRSNNGPSSNSTGADDKNDNSNQKSSSSTSTAKPVAATSAPEPAMAVK